MTEPRWLWWAAPLALLAVVALWLLPHMAAPVAVVGGGAAAGAAMRRRAKREVERLRDYDPEPPAPDPPAPTPEVGEWDEGPAGRPLP